MDRAIYFESAMSDKQLLKSILLIVDDESSVCRALSRIFRSCVDEVLTAFSPIEAETVLATKKITHLICDQWFGIGQPLGLDLVVKWKREHPSISRIVILTGTDVTQLEMPPDVDRIMDKTVDPKLLMGVLELNLA